MVLKVLVCSSSFTYIMLMEWMHACNSAVMISKTKEDKDFLNLKVKHPGNLITEQMMDDEGIYNAG